MQGIGDQDGADGRAADSHQLGGLEQHSYIAMLH